MVATVIVLPALCIVQAQRYFTVRDSIEKTVFVNDPQNRGEVETRFSPDGRYFFVRTTRGILRTNQVESTIWLFDSAAVVNALKMGQKSVASKPRRLVRVAASSNLVRADPLEQAQWAADGESISFIGRNRNSERHLFVVNLKSGQSRQLSRDGRDVISYDRAGDSFIFATIPFVSESRLYQSGGPELPDIHHGTGLSIFSLLYPEREGVTFGGAPRDLWQVRNGKATRVAAGGGSNPVSIVGATTRAVLSLSPSGRYAIVTSAAAHVPAAWESYDAGFRFSPIVADKPGVKPAIDRLRPVQYNLIDLQSGKMSVLIDAPVGSSTGFLHVQKALWSTNEKEVLLTNAYLPLEGASATGLPRSKRPWVVAVEIGGREITAIKELPPREESTVNLTDIEWKVPDREIVLRYHDGAGGTKGEPQVFERRDGNWRGVANEAVRAVGAKEAARGFSVAVRQSLNDPPVLTATDIKTKASKVIWDPNPEFAGIRLGEAAVYKWHDKDGKEWSGGLLKPPDFVAGRRYPLVIQTHGFNPREFLSDGPYPTAMAARPIAARGLLVLQVGEIPIGPNIMSTSKETAIVSQGYLSAIDQLNAEGLIDPRRVGITGFSRTGWHVLTSLLKEPDYFAAATLAECTYISFGEYTLNADYGGPGRAKNIASTIGTEPFGKGLNKWISDSAGFNTDKIDIPILFEANSPTALIYAWDMYALMRLQNKPVDLLYFRNGTHVLVKPLQRLVSQEMSVDWYDFWLNGHEDPDPAKTAQYARWHELRKQQESNNRK